MVTDMVHYDKNFLNSKNIILSQVKHVSALTKYIPRSRHDGQGLLH